MNITDELITKLKERYSHLHPLLFQRSLERAKSAGDLFDILDTASKDYPVVWDEEQRRWVYTKDLFQSAQLANKVKGI